MPKDGNNSTAKTSQFSALIKEAVRKLAGVEELSDNILLATVKSVDEPNFTCEVDPIDGSAELTDVRLKPEGVDPAFFPVPEIGSVVLVGLINESDGLVIMFSAVSNIMVKASGSVELQGNGNSAVAYAPLNTQMQDLVSQIQAELVKIQTGIVGAGGSYTPGTLSLDLTSAEVDNVKLP